MKQSKQVYFSHGKSARFGANWLSQSLKKRPKLKIPLRLQFQMTVSVNDFKPHKWLLWSIEFNETVKTSLLLSWQERPFWSKLALSEPQKGTKIENSVETSISNDSVCQWFHSTQMVVMVNIIQWKSQNKSTSLMARAPVLLLIGPLRASKMDQNWKFCWDFNFNWQCLSMISYHTNGCYGQ